MHNLTWLSQEALRIHDFFSSIFYGIVTILILLAVVIEYFRLPLGGMPGVTTIIGRAIVAVILLKSYSDISNTIVELSDAVAERIGDLNKFDVVLHRMGEKLSTLSASWVSVKETITLAMCFVSFFGLYFSVFIAEAIQTFTWVISYILSPILIALFVIPATATATSALFRTLLEVSFWKIVWAILATLLWSTALTDINTEAAELNFVTVIVYNLILAGSILLTPMVVHSLFNAGLAGYTRTIGGVAVGASVVTPAKLYSTGKNFVQRRLPQPKRREDTNSSSNNQ